MNTRLVNPHLTTNTTDRPNVVFIMADDLGWRDLSCTGSDFYETPHIDSLARQGVGFTNAYAACPVCSPTRASLLSGKYPARLGLTNYIGGPEHARAGSERGRVLSTPYIPYLPATETSLAKAFKGHGYRTWHVGKWHLGGPDYWPEVHGFDVNIGGCDMGHPRGRGHYFPPWDIPTLAPKDGDDYLDDRLGDEAAALIRNHDGQPFFLNLWFYLVHTPLMAHRDLVAKFREKARAMGLDQVDALVEGEHHPSEHKKHERIVRRIIQSEPTYAAMVEHLDRNVGKVLQALEDTGIADNTIVVFTSDNGGLSTAEGSPTCNAPLAEGKGWLYEGGNREPLLMRWPGHFPAAAQSDAIVTSPDFYPTLLEACGLPPMPGQHIDGRSFLPALQAPDKHHDRGAVFWHYPHYGNQGGEPGCAVRKNNWKLIEFFGGPVVLFDLDADPGERHDLADKQPETTAALMAELHAWRNEIGALIPENNPDWKPWHDKNLDACD